MFKFTKDEPKIYLEEQSPLCNITVVVEGDSRCTYMYLFSNNKFQSACWIMNHNKAPIETDVKAMRSGKAPMLKSSLCVKPDGHESIEGKKLEVIWFEEGNGASLKLDNDIVAIMPSWSGEQCPGYSRFCNEPSDHAWPLADDNLLIERTHISERYWSKWDSEDFWPVIQKEYIKHVSDFLGDDFRYFSIDNNVWPPKALVQGEIDEITYCITIGVSINKQPGVENYTDEYSKLNRFELGFAIKTSEFEKNSNQILRYLSGQTSFPWHNQSWLGNCHTLSFEEITHINELFTSSLLLSNKSKYKEYLPQIDFGLSFDEPVNILWIVPISDNVLAKMQDVGVEDFIDDKGRLDSISIFDGEEKFI